MSSASTVKPKQQTTAVKPKPVIAAKQTYPTKWSKTDITFDPSKLEFIAFYNPDEGANIRFTHFPLNGMFGFPIGGNFYECEIKFVMGDKKEYTANNSEVLFQANKSNDSATIKKIVESTAGSAFRLGRAVKDLRADWDTARFDIMYQIVLAKFTQNLDLKQMLLETGNRYLVEHTPKDKYWADGGNGNGQNNLGIVLMMVREALGGIGVVKAPKQYHDWLIEPTGHIGA